MSDYLNFINIENFRNFSKLTEFNFAPITFLIGPNNSGKSSLLKLLILLRESSKQENEIANLNFSTPGHNLGYFANVISHESITEDIRIELPFYMDTLDVDLTLVLKYGMHGESGLLKYISVQSQDNIYFEIEYHDSTDEIICNFKCDLELIRNSFATKPSLDEKEWITIENLFDNPTDKFSNEGNSIKPEPEKYYLTSIFNTFWLTRDTIFNKPPPIEARNSLTYFQTELGDQDEINKGILNWLKTQGFSYKFNTSHELVKNNHLNYWQKINNLLSNNTYNNRTTIIELILNKLSIYFENYQGLSALGKYIFEEVIDKSFNRGLSGLRYGIKRLYSTSSNRGSKDRLLSNSSAESELNELALIFNRDELKLENNIIDFINDSLKLFSIGDKISIERIHGVASQLFVHIGNKKIQLADLGFGYSQLIPLILKIAIIAGNEYNKLEAEYNHTILLLEEPESNLHPSLQSKLADLFLMAGERFNIQFIIETHSEYLIRKMQYHIAKKQIKAKDANIYYFNQKDNQAEEGLLRRINFEEDGSLTAEFGNGFFDEADKIAIELFTMVNRGKN